MARHNDTGSRGEALAEAHLTAAGYTILHRNWRSGRKEVDLIAQRADELVFVEVKTRTSAGFGWPEEAVDARKQQHFREAGEAFLLDHPQYPTLRFDIIAVLLDREGILVELIHYEGAFW